MLIRSLMMSAAFLLFLMPQTILAQVPDNCTLITLTDPQRAALNCGGVLIVELEEGTVLKYFGENNGLPRRLTLENGAALIEVEPGTDAPQIRTPHAIAAVRGTIYVVDVSAGATSVFVLRGEVEVRNTLGMLNIATLTAGKGVDVAPGQNFSVEDWGEARVRNLLARFGR